MPLLGRTQYFLGLVVLTLNATRSPVGFCSVSVHGTFLRSSNLRGAAQQWAAQADVSKYAAVKPLPPSQ